MLPTVLLKRSQKESLTPRFYRVSDGFSRSFFPGVL